MSSDATSWSPAGEMTFHAARRSRARTAGWAFHALLRQHTPVPFVTYALFGVNVGAFLLTAALGAGFFEADWLRLRALGAGYGPDTTGGQWWRLLTATFMHAGIGHLLGNMIFFWFIGRFMERLLGHTPFLVLYLGSALTGSLASLLWSPGRLTVGASGAVFGLFAGILGFLVRRDRDRLAQGILRPARNMAGAFLLYQLLFGGWGGGVDVAAHLGGALGGALLGYLMAHPVTEAGVARRPRLAAVGASVILVLTVGVAATRPRYADVLDLMLVYAPKADALDATDRERFVTVGPASRAKRATLLEAQLIPGWHDLVDLCDAYPGPSPRPFELVIDTLRRNADLRHQAAVLHLDALRSNDPSKAERARALEKKAHQQARFLREQLR